jgi:transaldolase
MKPTKTLHDLGQSLWLDNITRSLVNSGTLQRYIDESSVTGLTSNPTIFDHAIKNSTDYDSDISQSASRAKPPEDRWTARWRLQAEAWSKSRCRPARPWPSGEPDRRSSPSANRAPDR